MRRPRRLTTSVELEFIKCNYPNMTAKDIAEKLDRPVSFVYQQAFKLELKKPVHPWNKNTKGFGICKANSGSFQKGIRPWNTGTKGICKGSSTSFLKGIVPHNTGYDGMISIRKDNKGNSYQWIRLSKMHWIMYHCKVIETARAIAEVGDVIVRSAKLEVDVLKAVSFSQNPHKVEEFLLKSDALLVENKVTNMKPEP